MQNRHLMRHGTRVDLMHHVLIARYAARHTRLSVPAYNMLLHATDMAELFVALCRVSNTPEDRVPEYTETDSVHPVPARRGLVAAAFRIAEGGAFYAKQKHWENDEELLTSRGLTPSDVRIAYQRVCSGAKKLAWLINCPAVSTDSVLHSAPAYFGDAGVSGEIVRALRVAHAWGLT